MILSLILTMSVYYAMSYTQVICPKSIYLPEHCIIAVDEAKLLGLFSGARSMANQDVENACGSVFTLKLLLLSVFHSICVLICAGLIVQPCVTSKIFYPYQYLFYINSPVICRIMHVER